MKQNEVALVMGYEPSQASLFSKILNDQRAMPDGFAERFMAALRRVVDAAADRLRADAETKAQRMIASVPAEEGVAA